MRAGKAGYSDMGVLQTIYIILLPSMVFGIVMMAEYWVECLPSQVGQRFECKGGYLVSNVRVVEVDRTPGREFELPWE